MTTQKFEATPTPNDGIDLNEINLHTSTTR